MHYRCIKPFLTEEAAKMAPVGSSQRNECLNSMIGSKVPKIQHYVGSESSDHRTAASEAQFNLGHNYVTRTAEKTGVTPTESTKMYVMKMERKRKHGAKRKSSKEFKRGRRDLCKKKIKKRIQWKGARAFPTNLVSHYVKVLRKKQQ